MKMSSKTSLLAEAIEGTSATIQKVEGEVAKTISSLGSASPIGFPGTAYNLPVYYGVTGRMLEKLADLLPVLKELRESIREEPTFENATAAGVASVVATEIFEASKYAGNRKPYRPPYVGFIQDTTIRELGVKLVNGVIPGIAVLVGAAPDAESAGRVCREAQNRGLLTLLSGAIVEQASKTNVKFGLEYLLVPLGPEVSSVEHAANLAVRVALAFGAVRPGDRDSLTRYLKEKVPAFVVALGKLDPSVISLGLGVTGMGLVLVTDQRDLGLLGITIE
ncbi:CO dehydrogenase/CO-methylating acetyl-CoA synthase complex subunit beta, partial [Candidatus Bathyarchaeota archaeon]|nr:CO dehydrogenase/CO-methylating acetyl-CoA synthase complex subunit beta [Candidatus Bathyarchaeota archaeon]